MLASESDAHFNVQKFYDTWEAKIRELIKRYIGPFVPPEEQEFYIDLVRVIGVVLSAVEHPKYWTEDKQRSFIEGLILLFQRSSAESTP